GQRRAHSPGSNPRGEGRSGPLGGPGAGGGGVGTSRDPAQMLADQANQPVKGAGREGAARYSLLNEPQPIAAADANLDGKVTLKEWMDMTDRRFAKLDHQKTGPLGGADGLDGGDGLAQPAADADRLDAAGQAGGVVGLDEDAADGRRALG